MQKDVKLQDAAVAASQQPEFSAEEKAKYESNLDQAKKQLQGQMILGFENLLTQMLSNAQDLVDFDKLIPFSDYLGEVEKITASQLLAVANEVFKESPLSRITYRHQA